MNSSLLLLFFIVLATFLCYVEAACAGQPNCGACHKHSTNCAWCVGGLEHAGFCRDFTQFGAQGSKDNQWKKYACNPGYTHGGPEWDQNCKKKKWIFFFSNKNFSSFQVIFSNYLFIYCFQN